MNLLLIFVLAAISAASVGAINKRQAQFPNLNDMINQAAGNIFQRVTSNINNTFNPFNFAPMTPMQPSSANATHAQGRSLGDSTGNSTNITISAANALTNNETNASSNTSLSLTVNPANGTEQTNHSSISVTLSQSTENVTAQDVVPSSTAASEITASATNDTTESVTRPNVTENAAAVTQTAAVVSGSDTTTEAGVTPLQTILLNNAQSVSETDKAAEATASTTLSSNATDSLSSNVSSTVPSEVTTLPSIAANATPVDSSFKNKEVTGNASLPTAVPKDNLTSPVVVSDTIEPSVSITDATVEGISSFPANAEITTTGENEIDEAEGLTTTTEAASLTAAENTTATAAEVRITNATQNISSPVSVLAESLNLLSNITTVTGMPELLNASAIDQTNRSFSAITATNVTESVATDRTSTTAPAPVANATEQGTPLDTTTSESMTTEADVTTETTTTDTPVTPEEPLVIVTQPAVSDTSGNLESATLEDETSGYGIIRHSTTQSTESSTGMTILSNVNVTELVGDTTPSNMTETTTTHLTKVTNETEATEPNIESSTSLNDTEALSNASMVAALTEEVKHMNFSSASPDADLNITEVVDHTTTESVGSVTPSGQHSVQPASPTTLVWTLPEFQGEADSHFPSRTMLILNAKNGWKEKNQKLIEQFKPLQVIRLNETSIVTVTSASVQIPEEFASDTTSAVPLTTANNVESPIAGPFGKPKYVPKNPQDEEKFWSILRSAAKATRGKASFPTLKELPATTSFSCNDVGQPGFYADKETECQVFYRCDIHGGQFRFVCPEQTLFSQLTLVCDHWYNVNCQEQVKHADYINSRAYDFKRFGRYLERDSQSTGNDLEPRSRAVLSQLLTQNTEVTNITDKNNPLMNHLHERSGNITSGNVTAPAASITSGSTDGSPVKTSGNVTDSVPSTTTVSPGISPIKMLTFT